MKLKGTYKGTRRRPEPPAIIIIECPGCGWRSQPTKPEKAKTQYVAHLDSVHFGSLECAFCDPATECGQRLLPDFGTLARHVHHFHAKEKLKDGRTIADIDPVALPPRAFK